MKLSRNGTGYNKLGFIRSIDDTSPSEILATYMKKKQKKNTSPQVGRILISKVLTLCHSKPSCAVLAVPFAGVSQSSIFLSQFSMVGFGISPCSKRPKLDNSQLPVPGIERPIDDGVKSTSKHHRLCSVREEAKFETTFLPAFMKVISGLLADLIQIPEPHASHHARVISFPLSPFCTYVFGSGLKV